MSRINAKSVAKYVILPGIIPRMRQLFDTTFGMMAFMIAQIYSSVRLLPRGHAYLQAQNIGRFGIRHVVAEAANHLIVKKENWDQIAIFVVILTGLVLIVGQVLLVVTALLFEPAFAQQVPLANLFGTPNPITPGATTSTDVVFLLMDRVFGVPNFFCTVGDVCTDVFGGTENRWPFHVALHSMFNFYSKGLLVVAVLVFLYFIVVVLGETITSGTPFGERFQNVWVPIRLVVALLLLTPATHGLNTGQWIVLGVAKAGSGFATNAWHRFNNTISANMADGTANPVGETQNLLALPKAPDMSAVVQGMVLVHACAVSEWALDGEKLADGNLKYTSPSSETNLDSNPLAPPYETTKGPAPENGFYIQPYFVKNAFDGIGDVQRVLRVTQTTTFQDALNFYGHSDIVIRFGRQINNGQDVEPICGEFKIPISDRTYLQHVTSSSEIDATIDQHGGGAFVHRQYFRSILNLWFGAYPQGEMSNTALLTRHYGQRFILKNLGYMNYAACKVGCDQPDFFPSCQEPERLCEEQDPDIGAVSEAAKKVMVDVVTAIKRAHEIKLSQDSLFAIKSEVLDRGWGGAGIWYNSISQMNGEFVSAVNAVPTLSRYPAIMETTRKIALKKQSEVQGWEQFNPFMKDKDGKLVSFAAEIGTPERHNQANALYKLISAIMSSKRSAIDEKGDGLTGNPLLDAINFIFGTSGLFDMRQDNASRHPIAQLSALGKGIVDSAVRNIGAATGLSVMGGLVSSLDLPGAAGAVQMANSLMSTTAFIGLTAGVSLYYIIPILPFIFFFFAVGGWVKGIFEAMVGVPLWALAHLRIDGEGLPGQAANSGYLLLFETFLRPVLIVFGLVAAMLIFAMQARVLNLIWDMVIDNVGGAANGGAGDLVDWTGDDGNLSLTGVVKNARSTIDQFFFTVMYAMIMHMMAMSSFKLVDRIPDGILRWFGGGVTGFGEQDKNPSEGLQKIAVSGGMIQGQNIIRAGQEASQGLGSLLTPSRKAGPGGAPGGAQQQ